MSSPCLLYLSTQLPRTVSITFYLVYFAERRLDQLYLLRTLVNEDPKRINAVDVVIDFENHPPIFEYTMSLGWSYSTPLGGIVRFGRNNALPHRSAC